ncbi:MAG TPA: lysylphosphatidylglycerol synthase transmembrane domain-containing protein [Thermoleophilaceae bacterium]
MSRTVWRYGRYLASAATVSVLLWRLGVTPFIDGIRTVDPRALAAACGLAVLTTVCCALRWTIVSRALGARLSLPAAVAAYYRSLFLNVTLPGGVVGDVHRGISHGREVSDVGLALRAVAWERFAGQVVQAVVTVVVLLVLPSPVHPYMPLAAAGIVLVIACLAMVARVKPRRGHTIWARARAAVGGDFRRVVLARRAWLGIAVASVLVVCGHAITFLIAARTAGITASPGRMLPLALLVMLIMVVPSVGGWGPREGGSAWAFAAVGLGAGRGVTTAVVYGVMVLVSSLPGAAVIVVSWARRVRLLERAEARIGEEVLHA